MAKELTQNQTFATPQEALAHYGVKGMKWGVRNEDASTGKVGGAKELERLDQIAANNEGTILEQAGVPNPNYERNHRLLVAAGVGAGIAALAVGGAYAYSKYGSGGLDSGDGNNADQFTSNFSLGLHNQLTKKLPPLDHLDDNDLTLPSSTVLRRVVGDANEAISDSHMYVSHLDEDRDRYVGVFSKVVKERAGDAHLAEMTLNTSISSPSLKKRVEVMKSMLNDVDHDPKSLTEGMTFREVLIESTAAAREKALGGSSADHEKRLGSLSDDDLVRETYGTFVNGMGGQINNPRYRVSHPSQYLDKIRNMGYNALVDDANTGVLAKSPLMLLTPQQTVKGRTTKRISDSDVQLARDSIELLADDAALIRHMMLYGRLDTFATPRDALAHYGVKGMRWGVRKDDRTGGGRVGSNEDLAPLLIVTAIFAGVTAIKARFDYVDSGKRDAKRLDKQAKKSGIAHEWKKNDSLTGPKTHEQLTKDVIPAINPGFPNTPGTSMNCRRCTFAYEMRRRGLDVKATKSMMATGQDSAGLIHATSKTGTDKSVLRKTEHGSWWGETPIPTTVNRKPMEGEGKSVSIFDALGRQPNGARGELGVSWAFGGGHSMAYEIVNNKPIIFCTQTQQSWSTPQAFHKDMGVVVGDAAFTRLDNKPLNDDFLKRWVVNNA